MPREVVNPLIGLVCAQKVYVNNCTEDPVGSRCNPGAAKLAKTNKSRLSAI